jgi:hypothetical protein
MSTVQDVEGPPGRSLDIAKNTMKSEIVKTAQAMRNG